MAFNIGLVMAGAVSAGAYTAGAIDFLLQALDTWYAAKDGDPDCPKHDVNLKVMTGASAGAFISAMLAVVLNEDFPPITDYPHPERPCEPNKLFDAWVNMIDIKGLLGHKDLDLDPQPVKAMLDSTMLDDIARRVFEPGARRTQRRPYVNDPVQLTLTLTNLRGVPYEIDFVGRASTPMPYVMTMHADIMTFAVPAPGRDAVDKDGIPLNGSVGTGNWPKLRDAALASGAFPIGLVPRKLERPWNDYSTRRWYFPHPTGEGPTHKCGRMGTLKPMFGKPIDEDYHFLNVDGGTMDNEPIGRARELLTPDDPAGIEKAHVNTESALLMIDPFPDNGAFDHKDRFDQSFTLMGMPLRILKALINQARFKPQELTRAIDPKVFNQFLIAPIRAGKDALEFPIACGGLGGFAGFFSREFRAHDFQLGRRNVQQFLRRHFVLPESNALFASWSAEAKKKHLVQRDDLNRTVDPKTGKVKDEHFKEVDPVPPLTSYLPIVPLVGTMQDPVASPEWPKTYPRSEFVRLQQQCLQRANMVVKRMISNIGGWAEDPDPAVPRRSKRERLGAEIRAVFTRNLLRIAWGIKRKEIIRSKVVALIEADLSKRGLVL